MRTKHTILVLSVAALALPAAAAGQPKPDLVPASPAARSGDVGPGDALAVRVDVVNRGARAARRSRGEVVLSKDARRSAGDIRLRRWRVAPLASSARRPMRVRVRLPSETAPGAYRLIVCADVAGAVAERREGNNCKASPRLVVRERGPYAADVLPDSAAGDAPISPSGGSPPEASAPGYDPAAPKPASPVFVRECGDEALPTAGPAEPFTAMWDRAGAGWTGGDGELSIPLPDGRLAWIFADTYIGGVVDGRRAPGATMINNSIVIQDGACLTTVFGGSAEQPRALVEPPGDDAWYGPPTWYWPAAGFVQDGELRVLYYRVVRTGEGQLDWRFDGTDIVSFTLPGLGVRETRPLVREAGPLWGGAVVDDGAFTYVFGIEGEFVLSGLRVARTTRGDLGRQPLEYWDGESWDPDPAAAIPVADDVTTMSFLVDGDGWTLVTQGPVYSREITARRAPAPEGPWSEPTVIARAVPPEGGYTYGASLHPELGGDRSNMLLSYSVNGWKEEDLLARPDLYRPRFVRIAVTTPNLDAWYEPARSSA